MMRGVGIAFAFLGAVSLGAASQDARAQSEPTAPAERQIFIPDPQPNSEAAKPMPDAAEQAPPASKRASRRRAAKATGAARATRAARRSPAARRTARAPATAGRAASNADDVPLPRRSPERLVALPAGQSDAPLPRRAPHRPPPSDVVLAEPPPTLAAPLPPTYQPAVGDGGRKMNVFAFVAAAPAAARNVVPAAHADPPSAGPQPPAAEQVRPAAVEAPAAIAPTRPPSPPVPALEQVHGPQTSGKRKDVARSVAAVFETLESQQSQFAMVAPAAVPDDRLLSPEPVLPPWRKEPSTAPQAAAAGAETPPPRALEDGDPPKTPETGLPSSTPAGQDQQEPSPAAKIALLTPQPLPDAAAVPLPADKPEEAEAPEPEAVAIPRYRDVPETVRQIAESLPDCAPDEAGTMRRPFGDRVLFIIACPGDADNKRNAFVLAHSEDGEGANVLMFPRPGGGEAGPYMHELSNPTIVGNRLEIAHLGMDPDGRPCRTEGRWRIDARGNAGLLSWRTAASCSGELVAASRVVKKASAKRGKSAKRSSRGKKATKRKARRK